jgi:alkylated DNA repair dioxygenase AlkB
MMPIDELDRCLVIGRRPAGFRLIPGFLGEDEQRVVERWILENFEWDKRHQGSLPPSEQYPDDGPVPEWADVLGRRMAVMGIFPSRPDHVLLRRYERGAGCVPHIDRAVYGPVIAGLTLGSSRTLHLTRPRRRARLEALLLPGDLYVMRGAARYRWRHSIPSQVEDEFRGTRIPRCGGFSVSWRYLPGSVAPRRWWRLRCES